VDSDRLRDLAKSFLARYLPGPFVRVRAVDGGGSLFDDMGIHQEIERALKSRIWLKSGGSIGREPTEALVAIDVNTGKYVGRRSSRRRRSETNLEAVREIVRLLRLRRSRRDHRDRLHRHGGGAQPREAPGRAPRGAAQGPLAYAPLAISDFGLVQLTRKRTRRSLDKTLQLACPACGGSGRIRSALAVYYQIQRALGRGLGAGGAGRAHGPSPSGDDRAPRGGGAAPARSGGRGGRRAAARPRPTLSEERFEIVW